MSLLGKIRKLASLASSSSKKEKKKFFLILLDHKSPKSGTYHADTTESKNESQSQNHRLGP